MLPQAAVNVLFDLLLPQDQGHHQWQHDPIQNIKYLLIIIIFTTHCMMHDFQLNSGLFLNNKTVTHENAI